jgi:hypothetical protein
MTSIILINLFFLLSSFPPLCLDRVSKESTSFAIITLTTEGGIQLYRSYHKEREVFFCKLEMCETSSARLFALLQKSTLGIVV